MPPPKYDLREFLDECLSGGKRVSLLGQARRDAANLFGLQGEKEVIAFIAQGGLGPPRRFLDSQPIRELRGLEGKMADAYEFMAGPKKKGYLAFFKSDTGKWVIKSFHLQLVHRGSLNRAEEEERRKFGYDGHEKDIGNLGGGHG